MRILHLDSGREMRGGQWQALRLVEGLAAEGHGATLLCRPGSPLHRQAREHGLDARPLHLLRLAALARRADLIHAHDGRSHVLAAAAASGRPVVVSRRVMFPVRPWLYRRAARCIAISRFVRQVLVECGVPEEHIAVVYDGVPALNPPARRTRVIAPASSDPMKGAALVRQASALAGIPVHYSTDLAGDLAQDAALLLYVTHSEGLGSAALLAMSAGVPVVASDVGGLREVVTHEQDGLLAANSASAIAAALSRLVEDGALRARLGEQARRTAAERFSLAAMIRGTIEVYRKVLSC